MHPLHKLCGEWTMELIVPGSPPVVLSDLWSSFELMEAEAFLIWRWGPQREDFPGGMFPSVHSLIGQPDMVGRMTMHYFDSRGVVRRYQMEVTGTRLSIFRTGEDVAQRFSADLGSADQEIVGVWEKSVDGRIWERDFEMKLVPAPEDGH